MQKRKYVNHQSTIRKIVETALIAALYVVLTAVSASFGLSYLSVQLRLSEVLTILPVFSPYAVTGLTIGCFISNLASPLGLIDLIFGTLSTFIAAGLTRALAKFKIKGVPILSPLPPVIIGAVFIGLMLAFVLNDEFSFFTFLTAAVSVGAGQFIVCYGMSLPLYLFLRKLKLKNYGTLL